LEKNIEHLVDNKRDKMQANDFDSIQEQSQKKTKDKRYIVEIL
jgi:hypothetical protein